MIWLEKKVTEWGCMQALIDFEGWRKWRGFDAAATMNDQIPSGTITNSLLTASPSITGSISQPKNSIGNSTHSTNASTNHRDSSPALSLPKLAGTSIYLKGSGKNSSNSSSTSTIVPGSGDAGGSSVSGAVTPTPLGKSTSPNGTAPTGIPSSLSSMATSNGKRAGRTSTPARPAPS